jgi:predicted  nucleic acid-binding Zn-ribbon protein
MITIEFDEHGNVVRKPLSFKYQPKVESEKSNAADGQTLDFQLSTLQNEHAALLLERNKLSTSIAPLVESLRVKLLAESPELAASFMRGDMTMPEIRELRGKIDTLQEQMMEVFDKIEHVKKYGTLPPPAEHKVLSGEGDDIKAIRHDIRRLDDLIYKTNKKLEDAVGKTVKADRKLDWIEKKSLAEAQRDELKHKIKRLEYEARTNVDNRTAKD